MREVYRDAEVVAFFPTEPAALGHMLVIPRRHVQDIWSIDALTASRLSEIVLNLAGAVKSALSPDGLNVIQSNGRAATQTVNHLHVHLVPRWDNDAFGPIWPSETSYSESEKDDALAAIRHELIAKGTD